MTEQESFRRDGERHRDDDGHMMRRDDDTEGHLKMRDADDSDDDTEGHLRHH